MIQSTKKYRNDQSYKQTTGLESDRRVECYVKKRDWVRPLWIGGNLDHDGMMWGWESGKDLGREHNVDTGLKAGPAWTFEEKQGDICPEQRNKVVNGRRKAQEADRSWIIYIR